MLDLLKQYREARQGLVEMLNKLGNTFENDMDRTQINSMIDSVTKIIQWLETGRNPYFQKGIDVDKVYHIHYYKNMDILPDIYEEMRKEREPLELIPEKRRVLIKIFNTLSERERECFIMHVAEEKSMQEIADELNIKKTTVQNYIEKARKKIDKIVKGYEKGTN